MRVPARTYCIFLFHYLYTAPLSAAYCICMQGVSVPASACIVFLRGNPTISLFCPPLINRYSFHLSQMLIDRMGKTQIFYVTAGQTKKKKKLIMMSDALCRRGNKILHACRKQLHTVCIMVIFFQKNCPNISWAKKLIQSCDDNCWCVLLQEDNQMKTHIRTSLSV